MSDDMKNSISIEDAGKVADVMEEIKNNSEDLTNIANLPSNNGVLENEGNIEEGNYKVMNTSVDPVTGEVSIEGESLTGDNETFEEMCERLEKGDFKFIDNNAPISKEELSSSLSKTDESLKGLINEDDLDSDTMMKLLDLVNRKLNKEEFNAYKEFPEKIREAINKFSLQGAKGMPINSNQFKQMRNMVAESLLSEFIDNIVAERTQTDFNKEIEEIFAKGTAEIGDSIIGYTAERNAKIKESIDKIEDPEKKENLIKVFDRIEEGYNLTELKEECKKIKIRSIDVENAGKNGKRIYAYDSFLTKYEPSQYNIYSIYSAETILTRNLINAFPDSNYSAKHARAFLIAFCKQVSNYTPNDPFQHAYMFYVIYNIVILDINTGEKRDVSLQFLNNIKECIDNLISRNSYLG